MYVFPGYSLCFLTVWNFSFRKTMSHWIREVYLNVVSSLTQFLLFLAPFSENKSLFLIWIFFLCYFMDWNFPVLTKKKCHSHSLHSRALDYLIQQWLIVLHVTKYQSSQKTQNLHYLNIKVIISEVLLETKLKYKSMVITIHYIC